MNNNPKKILGFRAGRYGDLFINVPSFQVLRELYPDAKLYININKNYQDCASCFFNHPWIDGIFISDGFDNFPTIKDKQNMSLLGFDMVFNPLLSRYSVGLDKTRKNPYIDKYSEDYWFCFMSKQTTDNSYLYDLPECNEKIYLNKYFETPRFEKTIAFHWQAGNYDPNNNKCLSKEKAQSLVDNIIKLGYKILEIGAPNDIKLENTIKLNTDFFGSIKNILGCDLFLGTDSGIMWALSGYDMKVLGLYSNAYYQKGEHNFVSAIQPVNPNSQYLSAPNVNDIDINLILEKVKEMI